MPGKKVMKIGVTRWGSRVSPLFDTARYLSMVVLPGKGNIIWHELEIGDLPPISKAYALGRLGITTLICGGISNFFYYQLSALGIDVIPWVTGEVGQVIDAFLKGEIRQDKFLMPGCRARRRRFRGRRGWIRYYI